MNNRIEVDAPNWRSIRVTRHLPKALTGMETLCKNLWWCWNESAKALFKYVNPELWHFSGHNPMVILDQVSIKRYNELAKDEHFLNQLSAVMAEFNAYMAEKEKRTNPSIAYFCMEYGLDTSVKIYSGGLGILAGDYLKESSDMNVNMVAVGLLYRYGYFTQKFTAQGNQVAEYEPQDFSKIPVEPVMDKDGNWLSISLNFPGRIMSARIWKVAVGRTDLYLLDTDYEANSPEDRSITHQLYGGDWENRLKQELLLGIGGVRALRAMGIYTDIYHYNEGHAAFAGMERLREYIMDSKFSFNEALELVRVSSLFTTHTPVPAGHDAFEEDMMRRYIGHFPNRFNIEWPTLMSLGKTNAYDPNERFSMSVLAINCSQNVNGVSMLHGKVSQKMFAYMYPGYLPEELHISYVTNGVHFPTWSSKVWKNIDYEAFGPEFTSGHYDKKCFQNIYNVPDKDIADARKFVKHELSKALYERLSNPQLSPHYSPSQIVEIADNFKENVLTIGFARRFATYKRATLLFSDLNRLDAIVNNPKCPVQFVFAGKAHPNDGPGQELIKQIIEISKQPRFIGKIVFVPGYDITLAKRLVQGVDVWMNNPTRPLEASGTSGEKAAMNGVMHFSVLDGWWVEGYQKDAGWALPLESTYEDPNYQNELDAATIYYLIENEIAPAYYAAGSEPGCNPQWIGYIKNTIAKVASEFTTNRMLTDYCNKFYNPQYNRLQSLLADNCAKVKQLSAWKERMLQDWRGIQLVSFTHPDASTALAPENELMSEVVLNLGNINPNDVGVELVFTTADRKGELHIQSVCEFDLVESNNGTATFRTSLFPEKTGMYQVATRVYAKHPDLPHRQDFPLVKWL